MRRTADSVLLTLAAGAAARMVSTFTSDSLISMSISSSMAGVTSTDANAVWRRAWASKGLMRTSRCTPVSALR